TPSSVIGGAAHLTPASLLTRHAAEPGRGPVQPADDRVRRPASKSRCFALHYRDQRATPHPLLLRTRIRDLRQAWRAPIASAGKLLGSVVPGTASAANTGCGALR